MRRYIADVGTCIAGVGTCIFASRLNFKNLDLWILIIHRYIADVGTYIAGVGTCIFTSGLNPNIWI